MAHSHTGGENVVVLAGSQTGLTVIPSPTPLTSLNYFDGKFLRADDLMTEKRYVRHLVELANVAGGSGVVHGFDTTLAGGDALALGPGLAIDPMGRTLLLPIDIQVSIADLIEASRQTASARPPAVPRPGPLSVPVAGPLASMAAIKATLVDAKVAPVASPAPTATATATFEDCQDVVETPPSDVARAADLYLLTIAYAEGLCGHEDVYGRLCDEACVTSTDRPFRVEGIVVRVTPLVLRTTLAVSTSIALDRRHLRSRVASAYFADDALVVASLISRAGLAADTWCLGARLDGGSDVPLGVIARSGSSTLFLDAWTARRERMEAPSRRYWARRMAMRPWETYLAQILQFQCQLHDLLLDGSEPGADDDPCRPQQDVIVDAARLLDDVGSHYAALLAQTLKPAADAAVALQPIELPPGGLARIADLRIRLQAALVGAFAAPRDRVLIGRGVIELPPAGYLPVAPGSAVTVNDQVRRLLGDGLDLRFCVVRDDFVPHALEEAQHMERISLLHGLDHPDERPRVDILVPDGEILRTPATAAGHGFATTVYLVLGDRGSMATNAVIGASAPPSAVRITGAGRGEILPSGGMTFALAGATEAPRTVSVPDLLRAVVGRSVGNKTPTDVFEAIAAKPHAQPLEDSQLGAVFAGRLRDLASMATQHLATTRLATPMFGAAHVTPTPAPFVAPLAPGEGRTVELWVAMDCDGDLSALTVGRTARVHFEGAVYAPSAEPTWSRFDLDGHVRVDAVQPTAAGRILTGVFGGTTRVRDVWKGGAPSDDVTALDVPVRIAVALVGGQPASVALTVGKDASTPVIQLAWTLNPLTLTLTGPPISNDVKTPLFAATAQEKPEVLDPTNVLHAMALQAIDLIAAGIGDAGFGTAAKNILFPPSAAPTGDLIVRATRDWVLFHRRRDITCEVETERPPVAPPRRYALFERVVGDVAEIDEIRRILGSGDSKAIAGIGLAQVDVVEFAAGQPDLDTPVEAIWADWAKSMPADVIQYAAILSQPPGDGQPLANGRLARLVDTVAKVTPVDPAIVTDALTSVPASLAVAATSGSVVILTRKIATACITMVRVDPKVASDAFDVTVVESQVTITVGQGSVSNGVGDATFAANKDAITSDVGAIKEAWLKFGNTSGSWVVVVSAKGDPAADAEALRLARGTAILGVVRDAGGRVLTREIAEMPKGTCPVIAFVVAEPPVVPEPPPVETDCYRLFRTTNPDVFKMLRTVGSNKDALSILQQTKADDLGVVDFVKGDSAIQPDDNTNKAAQLWKDAGDGGNKFTYVFSREGDPAAGSQDDRSKRVERIWGELIGVNAADVLFRELGDAIPGDCPVMVVIFAA